MITLKEACDIVVSKIENIEVASVFELDDSWIIGYRDSITKELPDELPFRVYKDDGRIESFFQPNYAGDFMKDAKEIKAF